MKVAYRNGVVAHFGATDRAVAAGQLGGGARARSIALALGVTAEEIRRRILEPAAARLIIARYPDRGLTEESLVGEAYDSLFKSLCAQAALRSADQQQVFAPFAFVSALAGALLAIETVRRAGGGTVSYITRTRKVTSGL
jgi:hypothetical protein